MTKDILQSIGRKLIHFFTGSSSSDYYDASSRQDISSLALAIFDSSMSILALILPLFTSVALARNDLGDALDQVISK